MPTTINNFTVTDVNHLVAAGSDIPNAVITIAPLKGYFLTASDFSLSTPTPSEVSEATFVQEGSNVIMTVSFVPGSGPSSNLEVPICIDGTSALIPITLNGSYTSTVSNATPSGGGTYTSSGDYGETITVLTKTFTADSGNYFYSLPTATVAIGEANSYNITNTTTSDANSNVITSTFTVDYITSSSNVSGDVINFVANAIEIYVPTVFVNSYSINSSAIPIGGESRVITLTGNSGANYTLDVQNSGSTVILNTSGVIPASGTVDIAIAFPSSTSSETYTLVLSGDLNSSTICSSGCALTPSFTISQLANIDLSFNLTSTDSEVTVSSAEVISMVPNSTLNSQVHYVTLSATVPEGEEITLTSTPEITDFTPASAQDGSTNGGTYYTVSSFFAALNNESEELTISFTVTLNNSGSTNVSNTLDLDNFITVETTPVITGTGISNTSAADATAACALSNTNHEVFFTHSTFAVGKTAYTTAALDTIFNGNDLYYKFDVNGGSAAFVGTDGVIGSPATLCGI